MSVPACDAELCDYSLIIGYTVFLKKLPVVWMFIRCMSCISAAGLFPIAFRRVVIDSPVQGSEMDIMCIVSIIVSRSNWNVSREILKVCDRFRMVHHAELIVRGVVLLNCTTEGVWLCFQKWLCPFVTWQKCFPLCPLHSVVYIP